MKKKLLILEDNKRDFNTIKNFLQEQFPEVDYYPQTEEQNTELKKNIKQFFSPNAGKKATAKQFIDSLNFNDYDGIILDYLLDSSIDLVNGINLYQKMGLSPKALILTKLTSGEFTDLETDINHQGLNDKMIAIQKGKADKLSARQIEEYKQNIDKHLLGVVQEENLPIVVILTALLEEYNEVHAHLTDVKDASNEGMSYESGILVVEGDQIAKIYIRECGAKMSNAAQETQRAINLFKPSSIFFVGIAGSRKPNDFELADVIFAEKIYSYEGVKAQKGIQLARPESEGSSTKITEIAKKERRTTEWHSFLSTNLGITPKANLGIIASGNQVVEHLDSETGKFINLHYNDTSAIEMEGYAFAAAAKKQVIITPDFAVIRGISDLIGQEGNIELNKDNRPKDAKVKASASAAAFTYWLIYKMYKRN